jgi:hypothetical protein
VPQRRNDGNPFRQFDEQVAESGQSIAAVSLKCERRTSPQGPDDGDATRPVTALSTDHPLPASAASVMAVGEGCAVEDCQRQIASTSFTAQQAASLQRLGDAKDRVPARIDQLLLLDPDREQQIAVSLPRRCTARRI